jgi:hypothetical protein
MMLRMSGASRSTLENQYVDNGTGNFTECISSSLLLLQKGKGKKYMQNYKSLFSCSHTTTTTTTTTTTKPFCPKHVGVG